jgi:dihydrofolate reductase
VRLSLIAAVARNGVIGRAGQLPWHLPADLRYFKDTTSGHPVIMGRRTFESINRPLPNRRNIVVSRTLRAPPHPGTELADSLEAALEVVAGVAGPVFVVGGAELYAAAIPIAESIHLTELEDAVEGDAYFPAWDRSEWRLVSEVRHERDERHAMAFRICVYERGVRKPKR